MKCILHACKLFENQLFMTEEEYQENLLSTQQPWMSWAGHLLRTLYHGHYWWGAEEIFSELVAEQFCEMSHYWWGAEEIFSELVLFALFL